MFPSNVLQSVQTFNESDLSLMHAMLVSGEVFNTQYLEFNKLPKNLGATAKFQKPLKVKSVSSLNVINDFQAINQDYVTLTVDQQEAVPLAMTAEDIVLYDLERYVDHMGMPIVTQLATVVDRNCMAIGEEKPFLVYQGNLDYAATVMTPSNIVDIKELPKIEAQFENFGMTSDKIKCVLPNMTVPNLINTGLNQFVTSRNDDLAQSWMLGSYSHTEYFRSNQLKTHVSGLGGQGGYTFTVTTVSPDGKTITFTSSGPATETGTFKKYDTLIFDPTGASTGGTPLRYFGSAYSAPSANWVAVNVQADADTIGGSVTVTVSPALVGPTIAAATGVRQNINLDIDAPFTARALNSHVCAYQVANNAAWLAMPPLPNTMPYPSSSKVDDVSKLSMRMYYGFIPFENEYGYSWDVIWGRNCDEERISKIALPIV